VLAVLAFKFGRHPSGLEYSDKHCRSRKLLHGVGCDAIFMCFICLANPRDSSGNRLSDRHPDLKRSALSGNRKISFAPHPAVARKS
ncbi:MAG TPA: hypothetical protein VLQ68_01850, partial [Rhizobiaceae bacterium]|nr:hypothetical protein [Rhizobiaceae bacterium]